MRSATMPRRKNTQSSIRQKNTAFLTTTKPIEVSTLHFDKTAVFALKTT